LKEIILHADFTGDIVTAALYNKDLQIGDAITLTESSPGVYYGDMPDNTPQGIYGVRFEKAGELITFGKIVWDGTVEVDELRVSNGYDDTTLISKVDALSNYDDATLQSKIDSMLGEIAKTSTKEDLAQLKTVLDELNNYDDTTLISKVDAIKSIVDIINNDVTILKKIKLGKYKIETISDTLKRFTIYDDDGTTMYKSFLITQTDSTSTRELE